MKKFVFLLLFFALGALAEDQHLPGEQPGEFGHGADFKKHLVHADLPELDTHVIYSKKGLVFHGCKGVVVMYPGTSGKVSSEYGIGKSLGPMANTLVKMGYAVVAFQPPVYWKAEDEFARQPYLDKYSDLEENQRWLLKTWEFVRERMPEGVSMDYYGRSTFAAMGMEAYHRYLRRDAGYDAVGKFSNMVFVGVDGHTEAAIEKWYAGEVTVHINERPEAGDAPVVHAAPKFFRPMRWQTEKLEVPPPGLILPKVYAASGARDQFQPASEGVVTIKDFANMHPGAPIALAFHHGKHDPNQGIPDIAQPQEIMKLIWARVFDPAPLEAGFQTIFIPDPDRVMAAMDDEQRKICKAVLGMAG